MNNRLTSDIINGKFEFKGTLANPERAEIAFDDEFDKKKNWTKQIKSVNGQKLFVWTRAIEYYD